MKLGLHSTKNTRTLREGSLCYLRSDVPDRLNEEEVAWLIASGVTTAVDLRSERECLARPCALEGRPEFHYLHLPVTGGDAVPRHPEEVPGSYLAMVDDRMAEILRAIEGAEDNVIYFCNAGKDRTGVVSALLLSRMGVSRAEIVADYMKSADNLREELTAYAAQHPEIDPSVIAPCEDHINGFLDGLKTDLR